MMKKLNDNQLEQVVGGKTRYVQNGAGANVRSGPGTDYGKWYHLDEGKACFTNGERVYNSDDGYDWVQLDDGGWVAAHTFRKNGYIRVDCRSNRKGARARKDVRTGRRRSGRS